MPGNICRVPHCLNSSIKLKFANYKLTFDNQARVFPSLRDLGTDLNNLACNSHNADHVSVLKSAHIPIYFLKIVLGVLTKSATKFVHGQSQDWHFQSPGKKEED